MAATLNRLLEVPAKSETCRLCHRTIEATSEYLTTRDGPRRLGRCDCHEYKYSPDKGRWYLLPGRRPLTGRRQAHPRNRGTGLNSSAWLRMDDTVVYCIACRGRMLFCKEYDQVDGYTAFHRCQICGRTQYRNGR